MSVYADTGTSSGSSYAQAGVTGGSPYAGGNGGGSGGKPKPKRHKGFFSRFGSDLYNAAVNSPAGAYELGKLALKPELVTYTLLTKGNKKAAEQSRQGGQQAETLAKAYAAQLRSDFSHPLRHPGYTALDVLPVVGAAGKVAEAGLLARGGASAGEVARAATLGVKPGPRVYKVGDLEVRGTYSRATGARLAQKASDALLQSGADRGIGVRVGGRELSAEKALHGRMAKAMGRNERVNDAVARAPGTRLQKIGEKLSPAELRALRLVAEEVPVERRLAAQQLRKAAATSTKEIARHQQRIDLTSEAAKYLVEGAKGKPVFAPEAAKLKKVFGLLKDASSSREEMLRNVGLMDEASQQAAKVKAARFAAGGKTVGGELVGGHGVAVSNDAPFIGNPVERTKLMSRPKVSSTGTFGHTRRPGSLRAATGGSVEHAVERNDVTNIVAERHAEAVRLSKIDRVRTQLAKAGTAVPRRPNDVFVWTDKLTKNERIPKEVRAYLDNPESVAALPEHEQLSIREKLRQAVFEQHNWEVDAENRARFEALAKQGKGVFVPRHLVGEHAKRELTLPGSGMVDAVNNAQKAGLVYAKLNYPVVQGLSNAAMSVIHQGFAAPARLKQAFQLDSKVGPETAAVIDDIMGQGAVPQAAFVGKGPIARGSQHLAERMSRGVDRPARRAAFLHEAIEAGYKTPAQLQQLISDPSTLNDLHEVAQRAKESIVDYEELGPTERAIVRRLIFVYPWQKGATKYAAHFVRDHPVQAAATGTLGQRGTTVTNQQLGPVPSYLQGVFPVGGRLVNPSGVNFFQTPGQAGAAAAGYFTGNPAAPSGQDFLAPLPALAVALLTRRDDIGRPLKGNLLNNLDQTLIEQLPAVQLAKAAVGRGKPSKTFPDPNDPLWRFLLGGLYPRRFNNAALNSNAALEKTGR